MRTIDEVFSKEPQITLYHYTSINGLIGIAESKKIWATNIYYLNDAAEITHASDILSKDISKRVESSIGDEKDFLEQFLDWLKLFIRVPHHLFVVALTEEGNLLSQWRSYTPHGKGVSIGFEPKTLMRKIKAQNIKIGKCLYLIHEKEALMSELLDRMIITFHNEKKSYDSSRFHPSQKYFGIIQNYTGDILQTFSVIKHPKFSEEREWRLVSPYFPKYTVPEIKFREGASMLVSYIEVDFGDIRDGETIFKEVYFGPTPHVNLTMSSLSSYLSNKGVCYNTINSCIPYREW
jgi:hypothetical protein